MIKKTISEISRIGRMATTAGVLCLLATNLFAQGTPLAIRVITSSPGSLNTNFTLIWGETDAVLVDVPFLRSDAYRLVADILDLGAMGRLELLERRAERRDRLLHFIGHLTISL